MVEQTNNNNNNNNTGQVNWRSDNYQKTEYVVS